MTAAMKLGPRGLALIKSFEQCRLTAYLDARAKDPRWTIGWGHTGPEVVAGLVWTQAQADAALVADLARFEADVTSLVRRDTRPSEFDALVSFAFNVGSDIDADTKPEGLGDSTLLYLHNQGLRLRAAREFPNWDRAGGAELRGLLRRRFAEAALYLED
ncbi:lysozyme [Hypericibacter terrae]|uniref:Lysozyme n=1 Tax=Hypericibacter terrae TaxID=2602015 RepID=A0A5J6MMU4_9PROT|nr:lysozyme [Hypericibacter terrae]QEX18477.1 lysozyme [Hypericibacter terrae]